MTIEMPTARTSLRKALSDAGNARTIRDLGSTPNTTISRLAYDRLRSHLEMPPDPAPRWMSVTFQAVDPSEDLLQRLHIDTRAVFPCHGDKPPQKTSTLPEEHMIDEWGIRYRPAKVGGEILYYEIVENPLASISSPSELADYPWPKTHPEAFLDLAGRARTLALETSYGVIGHPGDTSLFETASALLGMERFLIALIKEQELVHALLERVTQVQTERMKSYLAAVGAYLDVISVGDDLGQQRGLLLSPTSYRELVKPHQREFFSAIKRATPAKLMMHSCGGIAPLIPDLVEIGVDAVNPVQTSARDMEPEILSASFGSIVAFWGGVDTQGLLRHGTPEQVRDEVRRLMKTLGARGRYILGAVHNIQPDIPPENIVAMYDEAWLIAQSTS